MPSELSTVFDASLSPRLRFSNGNTTVDNSTHTDDHCWRATIGSTPLQVPVQAACLCGLVDGDFVCSQFDSRLVQSIRSSLPVDQGCVAWRVRVDLLEGNEHFIVGACVSKRAKALAKRYDPLYDKGFFGIFTYWGLGFDVYTAGKQIENIKGQAPFFEEGGEATVELDTEAGALTVRSSSGKQRTFELPKGKRWRPVVCLFNRPDAQARATLLPAA